MTRFGCRFAAASADDELLDTDDVDAVMPLSGGATTMVW